MAGFIIGILLILASVTVGSTFIAKKLKGAGYGTLFCGILFGILLIFFGCIASIPTGRIGVLSTFGRVENYTLDSGFHVKYPWQSVHKMDTRVQKATIDLMCFSSDIQEVTCKYTVNYQVSKTNAQDIYKTIGMDYYDTVVSPTISESVKTILACYTAEDLIGNREEFSHAIEEKLSESLKLYNIEVVSTSVEDMDFTDVFTNAVESKQVAVQNKLKAQTEQEQKTMEAEQAAERACIEASAAAEVAEIKAKSDYEVAKIQADADEYTGKKEAEKNKAIASSLTDELANYYYIQQWNGQLPNTYVGSDDVTTVVGLDEK